MNEEQDSASAARVFGQLLMLPIAAFVYGIEVLIKTMQGIQEISNQSMEVIAGPQAWTSGLPQVRAAPSVQSQPDSTNAFDVAGATGTKPSTNQKEEETLSITGTYESGQDKDLHDDMLKLVRYKILFVKREYEVAFPEREDLVSENMDGTAFAAWKVAEFIQQLGNGNTDVPGKWGNKYPSEDRDKYVSNGKLKAFPDDDKKYLRVYYEVLERYPREKFKYEEQQIRVLEEIRDKLA
jgi:hypothetical protein